MPKQTGLGMTVSVDDSAGSLKNISNDVRSVNIGTSRGVQDVTGVDKSAMERLLLIADGTVTLAGILNPDANLSHDVFKTVCTSAVVRTTTLNYGTPTLSMELLYSKYDVTRADSGELTWTAEGSLANGTAPTWT
jgi:hypothetical protein